MTPDKPKPCWCVVRNDGVAQVIVRTLGSVTLQMLDRMFPTDAPHRRVRYFPVATPTKRAGKR